MNSQYFNAKDVSTATKFSELLKKIDSQKANYKTRNIYGDDCLAIAIENCNYQKKKKILYQLQFICFDLELLDLIRNSKNFKQIPFPLLGDSEERKAMLTTM
jgi:hypothetical protein